MEISLCPAQQHAFDALSSSLQDGHVFVLSGGCGMGKTTVLRALHATMGGAFLGMRNFLDNAEELCREVSAWESDRNRRSVNVDWQFTTDKARTKLKRLYPVIRS